MKKYDVYNLEFPRDFDELSIGDYKFKKVAHYNENLSKLQQRVSYFSNGLNIKKNTGNHQITATIELPVKEKAAVLPWRSKPITQLDDILLLLSIFTTRNVFAKYWTGDDPIIADFRQHNFGHSLILSLDDNNENFEKNINKVLGLISSSSWQKEYLAGYFLFIYRDVIKVQPLENSFLFSWIIWEHIFSIKNQNWLKKEEIHKLPGNNKIAYILDRYFLKKIDESAQKAINKLARARNRIIHFGMIDPCVTKKDIELFIKLTERLVAIILQLQEENVFNTMEKLETFLQKQQS